MRLKGINYDLGCRYSSKYKTYDSFNREELNNHLKFIREELNANAIKFYSSDMDRLIKASSIAENSGFEVFIQPKFLNKNMEGVKKGIKLLSKNINDSIHLLLGNEITLETKIQFPEDDYDKRVERFFNEREKINLTETIEEMKGIVRENFSGKISYSAFRWERVDWNILDFICINLYVNCLSSEEYKSKLNSLTSQYEKPVYLGEFGSATFKGSFQYGSLGWKIAHEKRLEADERGQYSALKKYFKMFEETDINGCFLYTFREPEGPLEDPEKILPSMSYSLVKTGENDFEPKMACKAVREGFSN